MRALARIHRKQQVEWEVAIKIGMNVQFTQAIWLEMVRLEMSSIITPTNGTVPFWNYTVASQPTSPVVSNGYLYVGTAFAGMYCLNATSGNLIWHDLGLGLPNYVTSSPAIAGGYVYVGGYVGSDGYVYCLNASDRSRGLGSRYI